MNKVFISVKYEEDMVGLIGKILAGINLIEEESGETSVSFNFEDTNEIQINLGDQSIKISKITKMSQEEAVKFYHENISKIYDFSTPENNKYRNVVIEDKVCNLWTKYHTLYASLILEVDGDQYEVCRVSYTMGVDLGTN